MPRHNKQKGGRISLPSEFFDKNSGRYLENPQPLADSAYGQQSPVSHGMSIGNNMIGPDLGPSPDHSGVQTGGAFFKIINPATGKKVSIFGKIGKKVLKGYLKQMGGRVSLPSEYFGKNSGRYLDNPQPLADSAYGQQSTVSHGMSIGNNMIGPDLGPSPNHSGVQTGGAFLKIRNPTTGKKVSIFGKIGKKVLKGYLKQMGGRVSLPSEYFGKNSGRYLENPQPLADSAYGQQSPVSNGMSIGNNMIGPDLGPSPDHSGVQTGGARFNNQ